MISSQNIVHATLLEQVNDLIDKAHSSANRPIFITSVPNNQWSLEHSIIEKASVMSYICLWGFAPETSALRRNKPKNNFDYEIELNMCGRNSKFVYYTDHGCLNINLGVFKTCSWNHVEKFISAINQRGYNYFNAPLKSDDPVKESELLIKAIGEAVTNPKARSVLKVVYAYKRRNFLSLAYRS